MSINGIGYTDSYGGLISAEEAKHLTTKGIEDQKLRRLDELAKSIKTSAEQGSSSTIEPLSDEEVVIFLGLGYRVIHLELNGYRISWEDKEDNHQSSSSENNKQ